jgi:hypothetical protein
MSGHVPQRLIWGLTTFKGNVSWKLPAIQVGFPIGGTAPTHNSGFRDVAGTVSSAAVMHNRHSSDYCEQDFAHSQAIENAKILALTGLEVLRNETYAKAMWEEWEAMMTEISI